MLFRPYFGALSAVLAPFCLVDALSTPVRVTVTFACLCVWLPAFGGQGAGTRTFSVCQRLLCQLRITPVNLIHLCFLAAFPYLLLGEGGVLINIEMSCGWLMAFSSPAWPQVVC